MEFLGIWERIYNPAFKVVEFDHFKGEAGLHTFVLSVSDWIESGETYHVIYQYVHNVYLPRRILKKLKNFEKAYMRVVPGAMHKIVLREENKT